MKGDIMSGTRNYFILSLLMGIIIIVFSVQLQDSVFRSAMIFGVSSGIAICILSGFEIYSSLRVVKCPICDESLGTGAHECPNCGFRFKTEDGR